MNSCAFYEDFETYCKNKYRTFIGVDPDDKSNKDFTLLEQIYRYAKNMAIYMSN